MLVSVKSKTDFPVRNSSCVLHCHICKKIVKRPAVVFSTILLGYQAKMVRIGIIVALSDTHFCILSRDCFNLSREYFSLWVIKNVTG